MKGTYSGNELTWKIAPWSSWTVRKLQSISGMSSSKSKALSVLDDGDLQMGMFSDDCTHFLLFTSLLPKILPVLVTGCAALWL